MSEFNDRVEAQRKLLKIVNKRSWNGEQLFSLNQSAIDRWSSANQLDRSSEFVTLLCEASRTIFEMANHSDDPICGVYRLSASELYKIADSLHLALSGS